MSDRPPPHLRTAFPRRARTAAVIATVMAVAVSGCSLPNRALDGFASPSSADPTVGALSATGYDGVDIGDKHFDLSQNLPDFPPLPPDTESDNHVVVTYGDADYLIDEDGLVIEIRPRTPRTDGGLAVGDPLEKAAALYGDPLTDPAGDGYLFAADTSSRTAWRVSTQGNDEITDIALCECLYGSNPSSPGTTVSGDTTVVTSRPYLPDGTLDPEFGTVTSDNRFYSCVGSGDRLVCGAATDGRNTYFCSLSHNGDVQEVTCPSGEPGPSFVVGEIHDLYPAAGAVRSLPRVGPTPYRVTLSDGETCTFHFPGGYLGESYPQHYRCTDGDVLQYRPDSEPAFDITEGTWTARKGNTNGLDVTTVSVRLAEIYLVDTNIA